MVSSHAFPCRQVRLVGRAAVDTMMACFSDKEDYIEYALHQAEWKRIGLDKQSRETGKLCQHVTVVD